MAIFIEGKEVRSRVVKPSSSLVGKKTETQRNPDALGKSDIKHTHTFTENGLEVTVPERSQYLKSMVHK